MTRERGSIRGASMSQMLETKTKSDLMPDTASKNNCQFFKCGEGQETCTTSCPMKIRWNADCSNARKVVIEYLHKFTNL